MKRLRGGRRRAAAGLAGVLALFALFAAAELVLRAAGIPPADDYETITEPDPELLWRNRAGLSIRAFPDGLAVTTGRQGFRGGSVSLEKGPGVRRVVVMGDSSTFGLWVSDEETYCAVLGGLLNGRRDGWQYEVVNAGVIGYTSWQGILQFRSRLADLSPDCIVVSYSVNDSTCNGECVTMRSRRRPSALAAWIRGHAVQASRICTIFFRWMDDLRLSRMQAAARGSAPPASVPPEEYRENLSGIIREARSRGIRVILAWMPVQLKHEIAPSYVYPYVVYNREKAEAAVADLLGRVAKSRDEAERSSIWFLAAQYTEAMGEPDRAAEYYVKSKTAVLERSNGGGGSLRYREIMGDVARKSGVQFVDPFREFAQAEMSGKLAGLFSDCFHPGRLGHRMIAESLRAAIVREMPVRAPRR